MCSVSTVSHADVASSSPNHGGNSGPDQVSGFACFASRRHLALATLWPLHSISDPRRPQQPDPSAYLAVERAEGLTMLWSAGDDRSLLRREAARLAP